MTCSTLFNLFLPKASFQFLYLCQNFSSVNFRSSPQSEMSFESSSTTRRSRNPSCTLCCNHGVRSKLKGHKYHCPFNECQCKLCDRGRERREVMRKQVKLRRQQMKQIYAKGYNEKNGGIKSLSLENSQKIGSSVESTFKEQAGNRNIGTFEGVAENSTETFPSVTSFHHQSSQTPPQNTSAYYEYSRFPARAVDLYPQNSESFAYYLTLSPPGMSTPQNQSPRQHGSHLLGRLSISENSAFVKFSPPTQNHVLIQGGSEDWPSEIKDSNDAALALASLQHKQIL